MNVSRSVSPLYVTHMKCAPVGDEMLVHGPMPMEHVATMTPPGLVGVMSGECAVDVEEPLRTEDVVAWTYGVAWASMMS